MKYKAMYQNPVEGFELADFANKQDAIEFAKSRVKGYTEVGSEDNTDRNNKFWIEVYDTEKATEDNPLGDLIFETKHVYND